MIFCFIFLGMNNERKDIVFWRGIEDYGSLVEWNSVLVLLYEWCSIVVWIVILFVEWDSVRVVCF